MKEKVSRTSVIQILAALMRVYLTIHPRKQANLHNFKHAVELSLFFDGDEEEMSKYWLERAESLVLPGAEVKWKSLKSSEDDHFYVVSVKHMLED